MRAPLPFLAALAAAFLLVPAVHAAGPAVLEGYVPVAAHGPGAQGSTWSTDLWIYRQGATVIHLWYNASGHDNTATDSVVVPLTGVVTFLPDIVANTFHTAGKGSVHYLADAPVSVISKTWTPGPQGGTYGQVIEGIPVDAASTATSGQAGALRMVIDRSAGFRSNVGVVNVSGQSLTVTLEFFDASGAPIPGAASVPVTLQPFDMHQVDNLLGALPAAVTGPVIVRATITSGDGAILGYLSQVDDVTNSGAYEEAFRFAI